MVGCYFMCLRRRVFSGPLLLKSLERRRISTKGSIYSHLIITRFSTDFSDLLSQSAKAPRLFSSYLDDFNAIFYYFRIRCVSNRLVAHLLNKPRKCELFRKLKHCNIKGWVEIKIKEGFDRSLLIYLKSQKEFK